MLLHYDKLIVPKRGYFQNRAIFETHTLNDKNTSSGG